MESNTTLLSSPFIAFVVALILIHHTSSANHHFNCSSSCGNIPNISYPFRLQTDPDHCGDKRHNLSCENDNTRTVLHLDSGKYYVKAINYNNQTIRVVDSNVVKADYCSSIPLYSLSHFNFTYDSAYSTEVYSPEPVYDYRSLSKAITFLKCENPVRSPLYIPTIPCINTTFSGLIESRGKYSYVKIGSTDASELEDSCRIELMVLASPWGIRENSNVSYIDIHNQLTYGFELSWFTNNRYCFFNDSNNVINCTTYDYEFCDAWGLLPDSGGSCGKNMKE